MRKKQLILVAFLLMLFVAPMILISSYSHAAIQNPSKDFSTSSLLNTIPVLSSSGNAGEGSSTGSYTDTQTINGIGYNGTGTGAGQETEVILNFTIPTSTGIYGFLVNIFASESWVPDSVLLSIAFYDFEGGTWESQGTKSFDKESYTWGNGTTAFGFKYFGSTDISVKIHASLAPAMVGMISIDYIEVQFYTGEWLDVPSAPLLFDTAGWILNPNAIIKYMTPLFTGTLDMLLLFLGLLMIPASTLYLARGGRSGMSMDKFFFGLLAFVFGWALFLGGIGF